jgi:hypothetical protein
LEGFFYNCIVKWNLEAKEECEREVRRTKWWQNKKTMWRGNLSGEEFIEGFWRGRYMLHSTIVNNYKPCVDLTKGKNS